MNEYQTNIALGSEAILNLAGAPPSRTSKLFEGLWRMIFEFERQFSRFLPDSELSFFNRNAGSRQPITPEFEALLTAAKGMAEETGGLYNPFILPALQAAGYKHSMVRGFESDPVDDHSGKTIADAGHLQVGGGKATIPYGTAIDLGGCGKGYLADRLADYIKDKADGWWFSLGGDITAGGTDAEGRPWRIAVQDAGAPDKEIGSITLPAGKRMAVASSGTISRRWRKAGKRGHHLIDPRSGRPAETDIMLATVIDESALRADVLASCAVVIGSQKARAFLKTHKVDNAVLQTSNGRNIYGPLAKNLMDNKAPAEHNKKHKHDG